MLERSVITIDVRNRQLGRPVLLLNGMGAPAASWDVFRPELDDRMTITYESTDAATSGTHPLTMVTIARVAVAVLDRAGVEAADVVGYSYGGAVAQQLALDAPDRIRRLVLVATSCGVGSVPGQFGALPRFLIELGDPWRSGTPSLFWEALAFSTWTSVPFLGSIQHPTLVIAGRRDPIVPLANARLLARRIPRARLAEHEGSHDLFAAPHATTTARVIRRFLDETFDEPGGADSGPPPAALADR